MKKENNIDQLFKKGMEDPEIPFNELDWQKMADKLEANEARRKTPFWIYTGAGIAAALLVVLFLFLVNQNKPPITQRKSVKATPGPVIQKNYPEAQDHIVPPFSSNNAALAHEKPRATQQKPDADLTMRAAGPMLTPAVPSRASVAPRIPMLPEVAASPLLFSKQEYRGQPEIALARKQSNAVKQGNIEETTLRERKQKLAVLDQGNTRGKLTFSLLAAPDITDSKTSVGTKISSNIGLLLTYPLSKKLSVSTGAIYARKLYDYGGNAAPAYAKAALPWSLNADCFVIDVPLNVNYQVLKKKNYTVAVNSGVSSYFMLKEKYKFTGTDEAGKPLINTLELNNENQHLLGIVNLSVSIERSVSDKLSIGVQPFIKLPLTGIGYYDYNLRSRGVAVSLNIKPFRSKK